MAKNLVIVESPAKAKTIQKYLGKDFEVSSCMGHIRDLPKKGMGIDLQTFTPTYEVSADKKKIVSELKQSAKNSDMVWLASDEDREGEAIAWHLSEALKLKDEKTKRIVFHEITKSAILEAVENPRKIDKNLVDAQQARRLLDRIVGFEMSPILWKKVKVGLSAGRVQSVAVRLVVDREKEIITFEPKASYRVEGQFSSKEKKEISARLKKDFTTEREAELFLEECSKISFSVLNIEKKAGFRSASAPFTTSTLQQEASNKLGYSVSTTMRIAQKLYEEGYITYMRTDSINLSTEAINSAKNTIIESFGKEYSSPRNYITKNASAQEAHEAIRPTNFEVKSTGDTQQNKLYQLIYKRTIASQMANAKIEKTIIEIGSKNLSQNFEASGEVIVFDGFLKVYNVFHEEDNSDKNSEKLLPKLSIDDVLYRKKIIATKKFTKAPPRYSEASLVKKLEELGIGRPSTYAPTIQTIQNRNYVDKREVIAKTREITQITLTESIKKENITEQFGYDKNKFSPTDIGIVVNDFLVGNFEEILDYGFTAKVEENFDSIAKGECLWKNTITEFYEKFHPKVENTEKNAERATGDRILGKDPNTGKNVHARIGRFGPLIQIGEIGDEEKPLFASLMPNQNIYTISLEEALELFKIPFQLNDYEEKPVIVGVGRFGPYVKWGDSYISIPRNENPLSVDNQRAIEIIEKKKIDDSPIGTYKGESVTKGVGRFGPFMKYKDIYINVPKKYDFTNLSKSDIEELISAKLEKEANRFIQKWDNEKVSIENGRWGAFIRFGKKQLKIPAKSKGEKFTPEELKEIHFNKVKEWIIAQDDTAFKEKKTKTKKTSKNKKT